MLRLKAELNRALFSRGFWASVAGTALALCIGAFDSLKQLIESYGGQAYGAHTTVLLTALTGDTMLLALPALAALPCTASFVEDWKSGYLKHCLPRAGKQRYIAAKAGASGLIGALAILAGIAAAYVLFMILFLPAEQPAPPEFTPMLPELLGKACLFALCGALWSLAGLAFSTATLSAHMAYASPFILCYVLVILSARYFPDLPIINPQEWLKPRHIWPGGNWGIALLIAEFIALMALLFQLVAVRRLQND